MKTSLRFAFLLSLGMVLSALSLRSQTDLGPAPSAQIKTITLSLKVRDRDKLEALIEDTSTPGSAHYHQFLSVAEVAARFSPTEADVQKVVSQLRAAGIEVKEVAANRLAIKASGSVAALNAFFGVSLHQFETTGGEKHVAPLTVPVLPSSISKSVVAVAGLSTESLLKPRLRTLASQASREKVPVSLPKSGTATGVKGSFTVGDVADMYQVNPLYCAGLSGKNQTIGIATFATFSQADAYAYWKGIGLKVLPNRITQISVDGGAGTSGSAETTLDVEQSGGLAPCAAIRVYEAPNSDQGFFDLFLTAIIENKVDALSISWGLDELFEDQNLMEALDQLFLIAGVQGMSLYCASGDEGAYDLNGTLPFPYYSKFLTVDFPASSPFITGCGGITLAGTYDFRYGSVTVKHDRAWGWDYLKTYFDTNYADLGGYDILAFPSGGGGGISSIFEVPFYQKKVKGVQKTEAQDLLYSPTGKPADAYPIFGLPGGFAGRNVPDLALNADPVSGYLVYFKGGFTAGNGGTSFVAPQLAGITALWTELAHGRVGFINPALYRGKQGGCENGRRSFTSAITHGTNLYYKATKDYNPATGVGSIKAANFAYKLLRADHDGDDD